MSLALLALAAAPLPFTPAPQSLDCSEQEIQIPSGLEISVTGPIFEAQGSYIRMTDDHLVIPEKGVANLERLMTYHRDAVSGEWLYSGLITTDSSVIDFDVTEDLLVVGESKWANAAGVERGRVRVYGWDAAGLTWNLAQTIVPPGPGSGRFGGEVARDGDWLVVTADTPVSSSGGPLFFYRRNPQSGAWTLQSQISGAPAAGLDDLAIHGDTAALMRFGVTFYRRDANDVWQPNGTQPSDPLIDQNSARNMRFLGDRLLVKYDTGILTIADFARDAAGNWAVRQLFDEAGFGVEFFADFDSSGFDVSTEQLVVGCAGWGEFRQGMLLRFVPDPATDQWIPDRVIQRDPVSPDERIGARVAVAGTQAVTISDPVSPIPMPQGAFALDLNSTDWNLDGIRDICQPVGTEYCQANPNSTSVPASITGLGSAVLSDATLDVCASDLPADEFGYLLANSAPGFIPLVAGSAGNLCLGAGPDFGRYVTSVGSSGPAGVRCTTIDLPTVPTATGPRVLQPGDTWYFQYWSRDGSTSNHTSGLEVTFE